ncbi:MAG TPA: hypothetical protein VKV19_17140 [Ktedonobacteraceae bacterium]|nr:hypothetical protein [Ktedonobacteraceae bacterium]
MQKKWLMVARDEQLGGSHILIVRAQDIKEAYEKCTHECVMNGLGVPDRRTAYELTEDGATHICSVLDCRPREGLFNGVTPISIGPGAERA